MAALTELDWTELDDLAVDTVRVLAMDAVQKVGNGHPGTAMSLAPAAYLLFQKVMRHNPADPHWPGRDRFVLSCGHSSLTLYIQLYLGGFGLELDDLKSLRTWGSKTPGHPEHGHTAGVETTTGPLGQGVGNAVGMAMAARRERGLLDPNAAAGESPFDHHIYAIASDGDLEEGVSGEASSIAGTQQLGNLTLIYDDNQISIEDDTDIAFNEDVAAALRGLRLARPDRRLDQRRHGKYAGGRPRAVRGDPQGRAGHRPAQLHRLRTIIAWPAPNAQNTGKAHGSALGDDEVAATKKVLGFDPDQTFEVAARRPRPHPQARRARPGRAGRVAGGVRRLGAQAVGRTSTSTSGCRPAPCPTAGPTTCRASPPTRRAWPRARPPARSSTRSPAPARAVGRLGRPRRVQQHHHRGRAVVHPRGPLDQDVEGRPATPAACCTSASASTRMGSIMNGIALHGGTRVFGGTFLMFSDYMRAAVRLAALMQLPVIYVWTHDSIGLGEDGPTHQPIEHLAALRAIPGLDVVRPADANETAAAWQADPRAHRPARPASCLTRQNVPIFPRGEEGFADTATSHKGGYVLIDAEGERTARRRPDRHRLRGPARRRGPRASSPRRASAPAWSRCRAASGSTRRTTSYRETVIPPTVKARVSVEAGVAQGWREIVGDHGRIVSIEHYGASADFAAHLPRVRRHRRGGRRGRRGQHRVATG